MLRWSTRVAAGVVVGVIGLAGGGTSAAAMVAGATPGSPSTNAVTRTPVAEPVDPAAAGYGPVAPEVDTDAVADAAPTGATGELPDPAPADVPPAAAVAVAEPSIVAGAPGIPAAVLAAYRQAADQWAAAAPGCHLSWAVLAGIGRIESGHAAGGRVDATGRTLGRILGVALDGSPGVAAIRDTDRGTLDTDPVWDRAVGPMQFIPTTWAVYRADGNGDGVADPHNVHDAAVTAARYLCAGGGDLSTSAGLAAAIRRYNNSASYVRNVMSWALAYSSGVSATTALPGTVPAVPGPPVDPAARTALPPAPTVASSPPATVAAPVPTPHPAARPPSPTPQPVVQPPTVAPPAVTPPALTAAATPTTTPPAPAPPEITPVPAPVVPTPTTPAPTSVASPVPTSTPTSAVIPTTTVGVPVPTVAATVGPPVPVVPTTSAPLPDDAPTPGLLA